MGPLHAVWLVEGEKTNNEDADDEEEANCRIIIIG